MCNYILLRIQANLNKPFPESIPSVGPHTVPISDFPDTIGIQDLSKHDQIMIDLVCRLHLIVIKNLRSFIYKTLFAFSRRDGEKSNSINILRIPVLKHFNLLHETSIQPLKAAGYADSMELSSKR